ncbi:MAG: hypothetical protein ACPG8W_21860, partial [Candidatus Promineifilaceae bacterium]
IICNMLYIDCSFVPNSNLGLEINIKVLMLNVGQEILDDLVPRPLQPIVLSVVTTLVTMFVVNLFSRKR